MKHNETLEVVPVTSTYNDANAPLTYFIDHLNFDCARCCKSLRLQNVITSFSKFKLNNN